ncbi:MAG: HDOD domain-containing protein [Bdellovibrionales bacterium]
MGAKKITYDDVTNRLADLPTLPVVVQELNRIIADPMSTIKDVEEVMLQDQSLTTKVLTLANSAYYAIPGGVSNLSRAIGFLGFDTVHQLVIAASVFSSLKIKGEPNFDLIAFWKHSIGVAIASEVVAEHIKHKTPSDLFTCGLVHDMGKIAIAMLDIDLLDEIATHAKSNNLSFIESERQLESMTHTRIGKLLGEKWKLPNSVQNCILHHHTYDVKLRTGLSDEMNQYVDIVILANLLIQTIRFGNSGYKKKMGAPKEVLQRLSIAPNEIPELVKSFKEPLSKAEGFLKILGS